MSQEFDYNDVSAYQQLIWVVLNKDTLAPYERQQIASLLEKLMLDAKLRTEGVW